MDVRRMLAITRKWFLLLVAGVILAAAAGFGFSALQQKTFETRTTLIVGQSLTSVSPDYSGLLASQQLSTTYAALATTRPQLQAVIDTLGLEATPEGLAKRVRAEATVGSTLLEIIVQDSDPARAAAIADGLAAQLIEATSSVQGRQEDLQAAIDADLAATQAQIASSQTRVTELVTKTDRTAEEDAELATLEGRLVTLRSTYATLLGYSSAGATNLLSVVEPAAPQTDAIAPKTPLNVMVAALLGLLIAIAVALLAEYFNESVGSAADVERLTGSGTLASIGQMKGLDAKREFYQLAAILYPRSAISEGYRTLRANLEFAAVDSGLHSLLVTSAMPGEGKSVTAANVAIVFAQAGRRVLLVDADLRKPSLHTAFGLRNDLGLTTALVVGNVAINSVAQATAQPNLSVLPSGPQPPNPAELLSSQRMRGLLERAAASYDLVVLDSPPLQAFADAAVLSTITSGTILVVDAERSKRRAIHEGREMLTRAGANVLGVVFNRVAGASAGLASSYGSYVVHARGEAAPPMLDPAHIATMPMIGAAVPGPVHDLKAEHAAVHAPEHGHAAVHAPGDPVAADVAARIRAASMRAAGLDPDMVEKADPGTLVELPAPRHDVDASPADDGQASVPTTGPDERPAPEPATSATSRPDEASPINPRSRRRPTTSE